jgi:hypothetical protein
MESSRPSLMGKTVNLECDRTRRGNASIYDGNPDEGEIGRLDD